LIDGVPLKVDFWGGQTLGDQTYTTFLMIFRLEEKVPYVAKGGNIHGLRNGRCPSHPTSSRIRSKLVEIHVKNAGFFHESNLRKHQTLIKKTQRKATAKS